MGDSPTVGGPWWGRFGGVAMGALALGWVGGLGGFAAGVFVDRRLRLRRYAPSKWAYGGRCTRERLLLVSIFAVAGHLAKADGRVTEREIDLARLFMGELALAPEERRHAVAMFTHGKQRRFPLVSLVRRLRRALGEDRRDMERFLNCQIRMAFVDGAPGERQLHVLQAVAASLRLPSREIDRRLNEYAGRMRAGNKGLTPTLGEAYAILKVRETAAPDEIKRAYRRMIGRFHPDRLEGQGLPPEEIKQAAARTREIRAAFDEIRRIRGF